MVVPTASTTVPQCYSFTTVVLTSFISVITTALLSTGIVVLVLIVVCKCHPMFPPPGAGAEAGPPAGGEEVMYEQVDGGVAAGEGFHLKENTAYANRQDLQSN